MLSGHRFSKNGKDKGRNRHILALAATALELGYGTEIDLRQRVDACLCIFCGGSRHHYTKCPDVDRNHWPIIAVGDTRDLASRTVRKSF